jgi:molecular chaperone GrpE
MEQNENNKDNPETEEKAEAETQSTLKEEPKKDEVDYKAKYFYIAAEMDNYRKRMEREKEDYVKFGNQRILTDLIHVMDNFDRTIDMLKSDEDPKMKNVVTGLNMVSKQFMETLSKHGLSQIESVGKDFDPNFHEALAQEYVEGKRPNEVVKEFQKGYSLNGRVVRAAKVVVASDKQ